MLGTRTKQVFAYGRRGHRIVNVADERKEGGNAEIPVFPKSRPEGKQGNENVSRLPAAVRRQVPDSSDSESDSSYCESSPHSKLKPIPPPKRERAPRNSKGRLSSPARKPLSAVSSNVPSPLPVASPVRAPKKRKLLSKKTTPIKALKPTSPIVQVDIVVLDERGHKVSQERRVSRTTAQPNPVAKRSVKQIKKPVAGSSVEHAIVLTDDEHKPPAAKKPPKPTKTKPVAISSEEESDDEPVPLTKLPGLQLSPESPPPRPAVRRNRRPTTILSPPTSPDVEIVEPESSAGAQRRMMKSVITHKPTLNAPTPGPRRKSAVRVDTAFTAGFLSPTAPHFKSRKVTPVRHGARPSFLPEPSDTDSNLDDDDDDDDDFGLSELALSPRTMKQIKFEFNRHEKPQPKHLVPLLEECAQTTPHEFSAFIDMFPLDPIVQTSHGGVDLVGVKGSKGPVSFQKIGEASYSEVFGIGDVVLKVIPLRDQDTKSTLDDSDSPAPSDAKDVLKEIIVTRAMGEMCDGFVELLRTYIVRGKYPSLLLDLWDEYNDKKGSENVRPDTFTVSQVYAIIVLPNGGPDLEAYTFPKGGWRQASSLFWQVARTLAIAEDLVHFEHRDLHWGQILVKSADVPTQPRLSKSKKIPMDHDAYGVKATVIDLGLSRMDPDDEDDTGGVHFTPFDDEVFEGEGDYQFDVYRMMRSHIGTSWETYRPLTNVMWLHYIVDKLLNAKRLRAPMVPRKSIVASTYSERECYECLLEVEGVLRAAIASYEVGTGKKGRRKTQIAAKTRVSDAACPRTAADMLDFGVERGWVLPHAS
ncbi:hypothetical protein EIP86_003975 [Pleurotus ostreatoroseus]|nr:hypothetical protein EIP86_003975 [Pleurotus ostreatoroseus]